MNARKLVVVALVGLVCGIVAVADAAEPRWGRRGGQPRMPMWGQGADLENAETPLEKESVALMLRARMLRTKRDDLEMAALQEADVAAAMKAALEAIAALDEALVGNPEYADMKQEREHVQAQARGLWQGAGARDWRDRRAREERMKKYRELSRRSEELRDKMAKFEAEVKEVGELKKKKDEAIAAFLDTYKAKLDANKDYAALGEELTNVEGRLRAVMERLNAERMRRYREQRDEARRKAEEERKKLEVEKKEGKEGGGEVENPFEGM